MAEIDETEARSRLQRLWKGTLLVAIGTGYALLILLLFLGPGWRAALLAAFLIVVAQFFRFIASDVDRVGWTLSRASETAPADAERLQRRLLRLLFVLAQAINVALVVQVLVVVGAGAGVAAAFGLALVETLHALVRRANRRAEFDAASYGLADGLRFSDSTRQARIERKLARLAELADEGRISRKAYDDACDRYRVRAVMGDAP